MKKIKVLDYLKLSEFAGDNLYIYKWEEKAFYAIGKNNNIFLVNISQKYNHLIIITRKNIQSFTRRLYKIFSPKHVFIIINNKNDDDKGFIIPEKNQYYTPRELVEERNKGIVIKLYCEWAQILYKQICNKGKEYFFIEALSQYQSLSQCFLNHFKLPPKGLFHIKNDGSLKFISDDIFKHFPLPLNITNIDVVVDNNNRITTCIFTTVTVVTSSLDQYENKETTVIQCNTDNNEDEGHFLQRVYDDYLFNKKNSKLGFILTGWNVPLSILRTKMKEKKLSLFFPWKIILDASECKEQLSKVIININNDNDIFTFLFSQNILSVILQLLHMTIKNTVKLTDIAVYYFYNFMLQRNIPVKWQKEEDGTIYLKRKNKKEKIKGGHVFKPIVGIYDNIGVVDFQSLYPNIIIHYGIMKGNVSRVSDAEYQLNKMWYKTHFYTIRSDDDEEKKWWYLSFKTENKNPIQLLFQHLIQRRFMEKNDILTKIIKLLTNSIYGFYYLSHIPSLYDPLSASIITRYGRYYLKKAKQFITQHFPGTVCLYGDTDSLFLSTPHTLKDIVQFYNNSKKQHAHYFLKLTIESDFQRLILIRKKQYIGRYNNNTYKFSGFPQKNIPPKMYQLMMNILRQALEINNNNNIKDILVNIIQTFLKEARTAPSTAKCYYYLIIKPNSSSLRGFKLLQNNNNNFCLENEYEPSIHQIDEKATILYYLEKILNPLLVTILKQPPLSDILTLLFFPSDKSIIIIKQKYLSTVVGYNNKQILDFTSGYQHFLGIKFNRVYFKNVKIQKFWESSSSSLLLSLYITFNEKGGYVTVDNTLFQKSPLFYSLQQLEESLISIFEYNKYNYILRNHIQLVCSFHNFSFPSSLILFCQFIAGTKNLHNSNTNTTATTPPPPFLSIVRNHKNLIMGIVIKKIDDDQDEVVVISS